MRHEFTALDLFSGIGGFALAFEAVGFRIIGFSEIDDYASAVLKKNWPRVPNYGDIRNPALHALRPDVICGGFPCQPVSHAGKQRGEADHRWLWPEMFVVIRKTRPTFVLAENVYGLVTHRGGLLLDKVYSDLESVGYQTLPPIGFPACGVNAPHRRERIWILAHAHCSGQRERWRPESIPAQYHSIERGGESRLGGKCQWTVEPAVGRVADGISHRVDRLRGLGNAVVPQVVEIFAAEIFRQLSHEFAFPDV